LAEVFVKFGGVRVAFVLGELFLSLLTVPTKKIHTSFHLQK
jgi:hypothetical protein